MSEGTQTKAPGRWRKLRDGGLGLLIGLVIGGLFAGFVYVDGRERLAALDASRAADAREVDEAVKSIQQQLDAARSTDALLRARIAADLALAELERANFGLSREQLSYVNVALAQVEPELIGVDRGALEAARLLVDSTLVGAAPDVAAQRTHLQDVVRALDALIPRDQRG
ncbi:MAG: hypothetical protein Q8P18_15110 [Pseudomonadota bacterium]|nr:hypothetical protein [Pseudomonadota bacterium]